MTMPIYSSSKTIFKKRLDLLFRILLNHSQNIINASQKIININEKIINDA